MSDILFEIGDLGILLVLWFTVGGDLAVLAFVCYAATGFALEFLQKRSAVTPS